MEDEIKRPNTNEILRWKDECHPNISVYGIDPFYGKLLHQPER